MVTVFKNWCTENLMLYTLSDTCPMCEMVRERLNRAGIFPEEFPASHCPETDHFPAAKIRGCDKVFGTKDLIKMVNIIESLAEGV